MAEDRTRATRLWRRATAHMNPTVFFGSAALVVAFVIAGAAFTETAAALFESTQRNISRFLGWYYVLVVSAFLIVPVTLLFFPMRRIRIGGPDARPEFSRFGWFTMLFAAGMGIGIVFYGVAEPLLHFDNPLRAEPRSDAALIEAMRLSYFHWGLHAWGIYLVLALAVAHAHFNRGLPLAPRSVFEPLLGERIHGPIGDAVDILCTVGTLLGVATSLGLGAMQINASLDVFFGWPDSVWLQTLIIALITVAATASVVLGVKKGIQRISQTNIVLAFLLLLFVFVAGPTLYSLELFISSLGFYLQKLPQASLYLEPGADSTWQITWTLFYWGWWISWAPFVAIFVARISKGRTVFEFVLGVLLLPSLVTFFWFATFGGAALHAQIEQGAALVDAVGENVSTSLQVLLAELPFASFTTALATAVIAIFFVTSSDSGSFVDDMVTSGGDPKPPRPQRVFWAVSEGLVAATLLLMGGLTAIRNAAISFGLPMSLVLVAATIALWKSLSADPSVRRVKAPGRG
ncbi:MAG: BCCT family transporter [Alphaproteobacteria bacterium]